MASGRYTVNMRSYVRAGLSLFACYAAGLFGALFVSTGIGSWYDALQKPSFYPPTWTFAPVWILLYATMAWALYLIWTKDSDANEARGWVPLFFLHLCVNASWTIFFFGFHSILVAFVDILCLTVIVFMLFCTALSIDRRAAYILLPYLGWACFATVLNAAIWMLN